MALSLKQRLARAESQLDPKNRYVDVAVQFCVHERFGEGTRPTGEMSPVYGGKWDNWLLEYVGDAEQVMQYACSRRQLELILDEHPEVEAGGGRGGGKTGGGALRALRYMVELPRHHGRVVAPSYPIVETARQEMLQVIPYEWIVHQLNKPRPEITILNGHNVQFRSADHPESLRSYTCSWTWLDEDQDITTYAAHVAWFCLRETGQPRMWRTLTPKGGQPLERHRAILDAVEKGSTDHSHFVFDSRSNCFIDPNVFEIAARSMDPDTYDVEVNASWETVQRLEEEGQNQRVFPFFSEEQHTVDIDDLERLDWRRRDITDKIIRRRIGMRASRHKYKYIAGVDPNKTAPNCCTIYKVYAGAKKGEPNQWIAVDYVERFNNCAVLGRSLKKLKYKPHEMFVVMDASSNTNKLGWRQTSYELLKKEGFQCKLMTSSRGRRNPFVKDSIDDIGTKIDPVHSPPSWFIATLDRGKPRLDNKGREFMNLLFENIRDVVWDKLGVQFSREPRHDPLDSARYPVSYFDPISRSGTMYGVYAG